MSPARQIYLVAVRDFRERLTSRAFQISTALTVILVAVFILLPSFLGDDGPPTWEIGVVGEAPTGLVPLIESRAPEAGTTVTIVPMASPEVAEAAVTAGTVDLAIADGQLIVGPDTPADLVTIAGAASVTAGVAEAARSFGLSDAEIAALFAAAEPAVTEVAEEDEEDNGGNRFLAFFGVIFLFISIVTYGQWILIGVIEEKSSRVVEVVLGAVRPHRLLAGKVLGIGTLGLAQLVLVGVVAFALLSRSSALEIPSAAGTTAVSVVVWFLLGFAFYATAYAAAGSLVSRQEEAQNAAFPLTILLMAAYFIASFSLAGDNVALRVASLIPPTAPMTMPLRMAGGDAAGWEVVLSLTLMVITTYLLTLLAGRIYAGGLLRAGGKVKLRDAWKGAET